MADETSLFSEMLKQLPERKSKGILAGRMLLRALADKPLMAGSTRHDLQKQRDAWSLMQPVAHLWAATIELGGIREDNLARLLWRSEQLLAQMQARADLRHENPWECSADMKAHLETLFGPIA